MIKPLALSPSANGENTLAALHAPAHAALLHTLCDQRLACGFDGPRSDRHPHLLELEVAHLVPVIAEASEHLLNAWKGRARSAIAAADFFTVEVLTLHGLTRYLVFFVIELKTRRVEIAGIVHQPHGQWMMQVGRNLLDAVDGFLLRKRYLILGRVPLYTSAFRRLLRDANVEPLRLPARSPNLNTHAERFVRSIRDDGLHHVVLLGEKHLRTVVREYVTHYHAERNHQGRDNALIAPQPASALANGAVQRRARLGGLLSYYHREAA